MKKDLNKTKELLLSSDYTCVFCRDDTVITSTERGVKPLLKLLDSEKDLSGFSVADKIVGKAAAFLYVLLKVDSVYAPVMSEHAISVFTEYGIEAVYDNAVPAIINRAGTGFCPMEIAVKDISNPTEALSRIKSTLAKLRNPKQ